jgi:hypothetical protein
MTVEITPTFFASVAGVLLSLLFSYVPKLHDWYMTQDNVAKAGIMAGLLLIVAAGSFGFSCLGWLEGVACTQAGVLSVVQAFIAALVANQAAYVFSPQPKKQPDAAKN